MRRSGLQRRERTTTTVVPFRFTAPDGTSVVADTLRYFGKPTKRNAATPTPKYPRAGSLVPLPKEQPRYVRARSNVAGSIVPLVDRVTRVSPSKPEPYRPREIKHDRADYAPQSSYSRAELIALLLRAARYA